MLLTNDIAVDLIMIFTLLHGRKVYNKVNKRINVNVVCKFLSFKVKTDSNHSILP